MPKRSPALRAARGADVYLGKSVEFTIGAEVANSINVAIQLLDADGKPFAKGGTYFRFNAYLSDAAYGAEAAAAPDGDVAVGTNGVILGEFTTDIAFSLLTDEYGRIDLDIGESGADTFYLNVELENRVFCSEAITFAA
jgi:hypothetical protein